VQTEQTGMRKPESVQMAWASKPTFRYREVFLFRFFFYLKKGPDYTNASIHLSFYFFMFCLEISISNITFVLFLMMLELAR
jgi:hypothetical protein